MKQTKYQETPKKASSTLTSWGWWIETDIDHLVDLFNQVPLSLVGGGGLKLLAKLSKLGNLVPLSLVGGGGLKQVKFR